MTASPTEEDATWRVVCLCAAWCGVCRDWDGVFQALAATHPAASFHWVDVEDEADAMGDADIETFPTLLVARGGQACFLGPVQPSATQVARLLDRLRADPGAGAPVPPQAHALLARLDATVLPKR